MRVTFSPIAWWAVEGNVWLPPFRLDYLRGAGVRTNCKNVPSWTRAASRKSRSAHPTRRIADIAPITAPKVRMICGTNASRKAGARLPGSRM